MVMPSVSNRSFTAIGMPASLPLVPAAPLSGGCSTVMNALSLGLSRSIWREQASTSASAVELAVPHLLQRIIDRKEIWLVHAIHYNIPPCLTAFHATREIPDLPADLVCGRPPPHPANDFEVWGRVCRPMRHAICPLPTACWRARASSICSARRSSSGPRCTLLCLAGLSLITTLEHLPIGVVSERSALRAEHLALRLAALSHLQGQAVLRGSRRADHPAITLDPAHLRQRRLGAALCNLHAAVLLCCRRYLEGRFASVPSG